MSTQLDDFCSHLVIMASKRKLFKLTPISHERPALDSNVYITGSIHLTQLIFVDLLLNAFYLAKLKRCNLLNNENELCLAHPHDGCIVSIDIRGRHFVTLVINLNLLWYKLLLNIFTKRLQRIKQFS